MKTVTMDAADRQLLATRLAADAADDGAMSVGAAEDLLERTAGPGDRLVAVAHNGMIGVLVDRLSDSVLPDRPESFGSEQQA